MCSSSRKGGKKLKKKIKTVRKIIIALLLILSINMTLILNCVQAVSNTNETIYQIDYCEKVLKYQGIPRGAAYVVYNEGGIQYPAYCINPERIGVGETDSYDVNVNGYINDAFLWRIITNGYPYKMIEELGVANEKEAYLATKQAIYCYLDNRDINEYSGIGEAGQRTLNALRKIWNNAKNSTATKISNVVNIVTSDSEWKQDEKNSKYISKTYSVEAPAPIVNYELEITGEDIPAGLMVTDINNVADDFFSPFEKFKILLPINQLEKDGEFQIKVKTKMDTKPVLYGLSSNSQLQNYALTAFTYEDSTGVYFEKYKANETQIEILKQEKNSKLPLEGVEFQLLDNNKQVKLQSLLTNKNGKIILKNIEPGTYYLKEIRTLPGYVLYDEEIKIDIELNEKVNVIVNNFKEKFIEVSKNETNIEVGKTKENMEISEDLTNIEVQKAEINIVEKLYEANIKQEINETNIKKFPKTGM